MASIVAIARRGERRRAFSITLKPLPHVVDIGSRRDERSMTGSTAQRMLHRGPHVIGRMPFTLKSFSEIAGCRVFLPGCGIYVGVERAQI
jgi:hypothetical protein